MTNTSMSLIERYVGLAGCAVLSVVRSIMAVFENSSAKDERSAKIVFVKFIEQGALVLHQNTFKEAAAHYGAENIYLCTFQSNAQLVELLDLVPVPNRLYIDELFFTRFSIGFLKALLALRKMNVDTAIDLEFFSRATAIFCFLSGAQKRAGYHRFMGAQNYRGDLFTHRLNYSHYVNVGDSSWCLLKCIELPAAELPVLDLELKARPVEISFVPGAVDLDRLYTLLGGKMQAPLIVINPSLNDVLPLRKWPEEKFREFVMICNARFPGHRFIFTGRPDERVLTDQFTAGLKGIDAINLCGKTQLRDILTLYSQARLLLTSDSGPAHFSSLTSVHTVVLFGPETPVLYAPLSPRTHVIYKALPCSPCYNVYNNRQSPCQDNQCMKKIGVGEVMQVVEEIFMIEPTS